MGRPREHDESTRVALLAAAETIVADRGAGALSVRAVADAAGTTTRAVYSLFGSKDGLLVEALARDAFEFLHTEIGKLHETDDPAADGLLNFLPSSSAKTTLSPSSAASTVQTYCTFL